MSYANRCCKCACFKPTLSEGMTPQKHKQIYTAKQTSLYGARPEATMHINKDFGSIKNFEEKLYS